MTINTNCLEYIQCPDCGNDYRFRIVALVTAIVTDDGCEFHTDPEWDDDSRITCPECERPGTIKDFKLPQQ